MELLYYYALAHQDSFDVRWINSKSIAEQLLAPLSQRLCNEHQLEVLGGTLASRLNLDANGTRVSSVETRSVATGQSAVINGVDAVVLAVGAKGMAALMAMTFVLTTADWGRSGLFAQACRWWPSAPLQRPGCGLTSFVFWICSVRWFRCVPLNGTTSIT